MPPADPIGLRLEPAPPLRLHPPGLRRTDSNSPVLRGAGETLCFVSHYQPRGHTLRAAGAARWPQGPFEPVRLLDDPEPEIGKWIQSVWRAPDGVLFGWYHGEEPVPAAGRRPLFLPHIGTLRSVDEGRRWQVLGPLLRAPRDEAEPAYANGFLAGGYGDFSTIVDREGGWFYLHVSSYVADESAQGVAVLRYPVATRDSPGKVETWCDGSWRALDVDRRLSPIFGVRRGWRHRDPSAWWGPAVHFNRHLKRFVMLLNWTDGGAADIVQRGVFLSVNADLADPSGWSAPRMLVRDGSWYPQLIGGEADEGDTLAGEAPRFFMSGFSAWRLRFLSEGGSAMAPPTVSRQDFADLFGEAPW